MATGMYLFCFLSRRGRPVCLPENGLHYVFGRTHGSAPTVDAYICSARIIAFFNAPSLLFTSCNSYSSLLFATMPPPA